MVENRDDVLYAAMSATDGDVVYSVFSSAEKTQVTKTGRNHLIRQKHT